MPHSLAVLTDFPEEGWRSMDLCGDMLLDHLKCDGKLGLLPTRLCPPFRRLVTRVPWFGSRRAALNADRLVNRFVLFPRYARHACGRFELFHVVDHSYAQLVHALPPGRAGVYCHDVDPFRCLIDPARYPRPRWFRAMSERILSGLRKAAVVFHSTAAVGDEITRAGLIDPGRLVLAPVGVSPEFTPGPVERAVELPWLDALGARPWVLHVGTCVPRKRVDILLEVVAAVRHRVSDLRLIKVGGEWTAEHRDQIERLGLAGSITHVTGLTRLELAEVYRRAPVVLIPSEAEGFGIPVIEALACGTAVAASDIPALREAGGPMARFAPVGDVAAWSDLVFRLLTDPAAAPPLVDRLAWAARFTWAAHAAIIGRAYRSLIVA